MKNKYLLILLLCFVSIMVSAQNSASAEVVVNQSNATCNVGETTQMTAVLPDVRETTSYGVVKLPTYDPFPYTGGTLIPIPPSGSNRDDFWSPLITLPFSFYFYGERYTNIIVGSNGLISFEVNGSLPNGADQQPGDFCDWIGSNAETIPSPGFRYKNAIYGVFQDIDFTNRGYGSVNYYELNTGDYAAPNRVYVINFYAIPTWATPGAGRQTSQIILHETTNVIEVNVERRQSAGATGAWNGAGLIGIQDKTGTKALVPTSPSRNTGPWNAVNESYRFSPTGPALPSSIEWSWNDPAPQTSTANPFTATALGPTTTYTAEVTIIDPLGNPIVINQNYNLAVGTLPNVTSPQTVCHTGSLPSPPVSINQNTSLVPPADLANYNIRYYKSFAGANNGIPAERVTEDAYTITAFPTRIWVRINDLLGAGCKDIRFFDIVAGPDPAGSIAYTAPSVPASFCNNLGDISAIPSANLFPGGTYSVLDGPNGNILAGLPINPTTGAISTSIIDPSTGATIPSDVNTYYIQYDVPATGSCPAFATGAYVDIVSCCNLTVPLATQKFCIGDTFTPMTIGEPNATGASIFSGTFPPGISQNFNTATNQFIIGQTVTNTALVAATYTFTVRMTLAGGGFCDQPITIIVGDVPTITGTFTVCEGLTTTLVGSATPATTNPWVSASPAIATVDNTGVVTGVSAGTAVITYTNFAGCDITKTITVNPLPTITGTLTVCEGMTTALTGSAVPAATNPWVSATPTIATVSNTGVVTGVSNGTAVITYTNSNGCIITATVTVNALPTITGTLDVCIGSTTALTGSGTPATTNAWVSASPTIATVNNTGVVTGVSNGTSVITYTNSNGCKITATVTVNLLPTITGTLTVCEGLTTTLTGSATPATTNAWVSASPTIATVDNTGVVTGVSAGTAVITYTNSNGCKITATVTVNALPTITGTLTVCEGSTTTLSGSGTPATTNAWVSATPTVATVNNTGVVTGVSNGTSVITYTNSNGCKITATVTVNALPTITGTLTVCVGSTTALIGSGTAATTNAWVSANTAVATVNNSGVVTGVSNGTSVITYTNSNGCIITATVAVNSLPTISGTLTVCEGLTTTLTGSAAPATTNAWVSANTAVATIDNLGVVTAVSSGTSVITYTNSNGCQITATVTVNALPTITGTLNVCIASTTALTGSGTAATTNAWVSSNAAVATVDNLGVVTGVSVGTSLITYTNSNGCIITATVTVDGIPTITGALNVCEGLKTTLSGSTSPAATNAWVSSNTAVATVDNLGVVTGVSAGTAVITYTNIGGCSIGAIVRVDGLPTITGTLDVCIGLNTTLIGSASPATTNAWVSASPAIATVSNTGVVTGVSVGTSVITYTNSNGCQITATVTVNALPTITGTLNVCIGSTTALTGSGTPATTNAWVSASPAIATVSNTGVVTGVSVGTSVITYTNSNGCIITATVTVNALPTITGTLNVCEGLTTTLTGSGTPATTNAWVSASPLIATVDNTGVVTGVSAGTAVITYTNSNGCEITATVTVNALPTISGNLNVCIGLTTALIGSGTPATTNAWISASPAIATVDNTGLVTAISLGTSVITYTNSNGCIITATVTVNALPTISGTLNVCVGATTALTGSGTAATTNPWSSSDTTVATVNASGVVSGIAMGTAAITYTNSNGCIITATVTVKALPTITGTLNVCEGLTTTLTGSATPAVTNPWVSSSTAVATISNTGVVTGVSNGTTVITYTNNDGCSITATVTVNALPTISGTLNVCIASTTALTGSAVPAATNPWISSNTAVATISNTGVVTGVAIGTSVITYTNSNGCIITATVTVNALPTITGTLNVCAGLMTTLTGSGTAATTTPWVSSNTAVATVNNSGVVTGVSAGSATITYTNSNGCKTTAVVTVIAAPIITGTLNVCIGSTTALNGSGTPATTNAWISSNTTVATVNNSGVVNGLAAGTTVITYTNSNGCIITATVTVNALPTISGTLTVCAGLTTILTGSATPATINPWSSSNTAIATVNNTGVVTGLAAGTTVITYTNSNGCKITATVTVNALPTITGTLNVCEGLTTTLTGSGTAASLNAWVSSNPTVATVTNAGVVRGLFEGTTIITYTNSNGCTKTVTITVNPLPTISGTLNVCIGSTTALLGSATAASASPWVSSNTTVATVNNAGVVTGISAGTTTITYKNSNGCTITATITVNALPTITGTLNVCEGSQTQLTGSTTAATLNPWISSNTAIATVDNTGLVSGIKAGSVTITYTNSNGCIKAATVVVNPLPIINLPQDGVICLDEFGIPIATFPLNTGLTGPYSFQWFDAAGPISGAVGSSYNAPAPGDYTVEVTNTATTCVNRQTVTVDASLAPKSVTYEISNYFSETQLVTVNVLPVGDYLYQVDNGAFQSSNQFFNLPSGEHQILVKDRLACGTKTISFVIIDFPKFFTPNGDGYNDLWNIPALSDQNNSKIRIFDRYGKLLKEISPKGAGWDGMYNGNLLPAEDYWFVVFFEEDGVSKEFKAHFSLKR